ncbi:uncharacterized protein [Arachis hypogaea]|uniref:uncharacterized protein n=1 Tax=Arachis hypogaea TaxID=3818 RepID=UPI000DEC799E|nr:uncharacterized protein LOC112779536 [Arachis hypogaea]
MERFNKACLEIQDLPTKAVIMGLVNALREGPSSQSISKRHPTSLNDIQERAEKYINMEENARLREPNWRLGNPHQSKKKEREPKRKEEVGPKTPRRCHNNTPLRASLVDVYRKICHTEKLPSHPYPRMEVVISRITLNQLGAVISTPHLCMKFPTTEGIATIEEDQKLARKCYNESLNLRDKGKDVNTIELGGVRVRKELRPQLGGKPEEVQIGQKNGKWKMCIDYTDLHKACPKDPYPLPNIDAIVDSNLGYQYLSFMDAYSDYNQIPMYKSDQKITSFITPKANYWYVVMPFGLKNAGDAYQMFMNKVFSPHLGSLMKLYVDDMLVQIKDETSLLTDPSQVFGTIRKHGMRLNPTKCTFAVQAGKFLGFMLTQKGIEANLDKCKAILNSCLKKVQQLNVRLAALSRFLVGSALRSLPLFSLLRKGCQFEWTPEREEAFQKFKIFLSQFPILTWPKAGEELVLYLVVAEKAMASAIIREDEVGQHPIYFTSKVLQGSELRYQKLEKFAYALIVAARRLRPYFQAHTIRVQTNQPMKQILHKTDIAARMIQWAIELSKFDLKYETQTAIKAQCFTDFIAEYTGDHIEASTTWELYVDGSSNKVGSGVGIILVNQEGTQIEVSLKFEFFASNNQAEYKALIAGLKLAKEVDATKVVVFSDSQIVTSQINGEYQAKDPNMKRYLEKTLEYLRQFPETEVDTASKTQQKYRIIDEWINNIRHGRVEDAVLKPIAVCGS